MTATVLPESRDRFEELHETLTDEYGEFPVHEEEWRQPPAAHEAVRDRFEAGHGGGAGAWVHHGGRVLLGRVGDAHGWSDPGGRRRSGESFEACARRAVRATTGLDAEVTGVVELRAVTVRDGTDPDRPGVLEPIVVFALTPTGDDGTDRAPDPPGERFAELRWFDEHPETVRNAAVRDRPIPYPGSAE